MNRCPNCRDELRRTEPPGYWRCRGCGTVISDAALRDVVWPISAVRQRVVRALIDVHHDGYPTEDLADAALVALGLGDFNAAVDRVMAACVLELKVAAVSSAAAEAILKAALVATGGTDDA